MPAPSLIDGMAVVRRIVGNKQMLADHEICTAVVSLNVEKRYRHYCPKITLFNRMNDVDDLRSGEMRQF